MRTITLATALIAVTIFITNCGDGSASFSLSADSDSFQQAAGSVNDKIDILWVVDNSGSMDTSQQNLAANFNSFIAEFAAKNLDYRMAFTTTDAYRYSSSFANNVNCVRFRDRVLTSSCNNASGSVASGYKIITPTSPGPAFINSVFTHNARTGILGHGDERAFQSMQAALTHSVNDAYNFLRDDSFLAIIIVSDEDDFSWNGTSNKGVYPPNYNDPNLHPVSQYVQFLDNLTNSSGDFRRYSVNAIAIYDEQCREELNTYFGGRQIGVRYGQIVDATGGIKSSLCGDFAEELDIIADRILSLATRFYLSRIPIPSSIKVRVNGNVVPPKTLPDGGWEYIANVNAIEFSGMYIPPTGAVINIDYDPVAYGQ